MIWSYHMKPRELAEMAAFSAIARLILIHQSNYSQPYQVDALFGEFKEHYKGDVVSARDGDVF